MRPQLKKLQVIQDPDRGCMVNQHSSCNFTLRQIVDSLTFIDVLPTPPAPLVKHAYQNVRTVLSNQAFKINYGGTGSIFLLFQRSHRRIKITIVISPIIL